MIAAAIYNVNRKPETEPIEHDYFMRQPFKKETEKEIEPEVLHAKLMFAFGPPDKDQNHEAGGAS